MDVRGKRKMLNIRKLESDLSAGLEANSAMTFYGQE